MSASNTRRRSLSRIAYEFCTWLSTSTRLTRLLNGPRGAGTGSGRSTPPGRPTISGSSRARDFGANGYEADREGRALNLSARRTTPLGGLPTEASVRAATTIIRRLGGKRASNTAPTHARDCALLQLLLSLLFIIIIISPPPPHSTIIIIIISYVSTRYNLVT